MSVKKFIRDKRGDSEILMPVVISVVVMLFFFSLMFTGASNIAKSVSFYEKTYAQQITILVEKAKPYSEISIDFKRGFEIAKQEEKNFEEIVKLDKEDNKIIVSLGRGRGYSMNIPSDYDIKFIPLVSENKMKIVILK